MIIRLNMSSSNVQLPNELTVKNAFKMALEKDKPIYSDYWEGSLLRKTAGVENTVFLGVQSLDNTLPKRLIIPSLNAYTSDISKMFKVADDIIVETDNSIYIVSSLIEKRLEKRNY